MFNKFEAWLFKIFAINILIKNIQIEWGFSTVLPYFVENIQNYIIKGNTYREMDVHKNMFIKLTNNSIYT